MPMTTLEASTVCLAHFDADFGEKSPRRVAGVQALPGTPVVGISTARSRFGAASLDAMSAGYGGIRFPGSGPFSAGAHMSLECWLYLRSYRSTGCRPVTVTTAGGTTPIFGLYINSVGDWAITFRDTLGNDNTVIASAGYKVPLNQWVHFLMTSDQANTRRAFFDGVERGAGSSVANSPYTGLLTADLCVGGYGVADLSTDGFIEEVRYVFGHLTQTADFTPPSSAYSDCPALSDAGPLPPFGAYRSPLFSVASGKALKPAASAMDMWFGGFGKVPGDVAIDEDPDVPVSRKVWLVRTRDAVVIREQWSDPVTGAYLFTGVDMAQKYAVIAFDHTGVFGAVIADNITPEPM